ncbi:MAG: hypothetical protein ACTS4U_00660 [Candidatus Hodgkinia cicadicola]
MRSLWFETCVVMPSEFGYRPRERPTNERFRQKTDGNCDLAFGSSLWKD